MKYETPSTSKTAFNCPHCEVLAKQFWNTCHIVPLPKNEGPVLYRAEEIDDYDFSGLDKEARLEVLEWIALLSQGAPTIENTYCSTHQKVHNLSISKCFNCDALAIWLYDLMLYPRRGNAPPVNIDAPFEVRRDYEEASSILSLSPRGAAALLRLAIQKLCKELGQPGKNINDDIKALVDGGLDRRVQKALDYVRVIGNNAVHPGQIDLNDDSEIADNLFRLLNLIVEKTISEPKHVDDVYASLPASAIEAIEKRDS